MINRLLLFVVFLITSACSAPKEPEFRSMSHLRVTSIDSKEVVIEGKAIYYNPNSVSCTLKGTDIDVTVNAIHLGNIHQTLTSKIPAKEEFEVPVKFSFPPNRLLKKGGLLSGIISALNDRKVDVKYEGQFTIEVLGIDINVPIEYEEEVSLDRKRNAS